MDKERLTKEVPNRTFKDLKSVLPPLEKTLAYCTAGMLFFSFVVLFMTNPVASGFAVVDASSQDASRFSAMSSLLLVIFAVFGLFLFIIIKRLNQNSRGL